jgi:beta-glucosidase-like glycosyl hydrolase
MAESVAPQRAVSATLLPGFVGTTLPASRLPGNAMLGRIDDLDYTSAIARRIARRIGWGLRRAGLNLDSAADADINSNPDNPVIGVRSFGTSPQDESADVATFGASRLAGRAPADVTGGRA